MVYHGNASLKYQKENTLTTDHTPVCGSWVEHILQNLFSASKKYILHGFPRKKCFGKGPETPRTHILPWGPHTFCLEAPHTFCLEAPTHSALRPPAHSALMPPHILPWGPPHILPWGPHTFCLEDPTHYYLRENKNQLLLNGQKHFKS